MEDSVFKLHAPWAPSGDQPQAIEKIVKGVKNGEKCLTLMGVTGSGKTFTIANAITRLNKPTLVLAHNKTLAAQLYSEFKTFFPDNAVHYFVSYYDYYQPEAYLPGSDVYIEKDSSINEQIERLRLATTKSLIERRDVIVVASVSCIYGLGKRQNYEDVIARFAVGERWDRRSFLESLLQNHYERNDVSFEPGMFRVRGDVVEVYPIYSDTSLRFTFFDDEIEAIDEVEPISGKKLLSKERASIFPARHYLTTDDAVVRALKEIREELNQQVEFFKSQNKYLEMQRLESRTNYDMEMLAETGYCSGIENYSRILDGRAPGEQPGTLIDFFPDDFLMVVDESHMTLPQVRGMYNGDRARKEVLVEHGFRLPSCLDNRPLKWDEFTEYMHNLICVSATPGDWERERSSQIIEQIVRPTGVVDPEVVISPATGQIDDLLDRLTSTIENGGRALVTTLTKKGSEDLSDYLGTVGFKSEYLHSELDAFERAELINKLRSGDIDVLVGVNLLREGIDMPEVTLVAILDADREGFLRSYRSLIQIMGRAARNTESIVVLYADVMTDSINKAMAESSRRRKAQLEYNEEHGITAVSIKKDIVNLLPEVEFEAPKEVSSAASSTPLEDLDDKSLEKLMWSSVEKLQFEQAARIRDILTARKGGKSLRVASNNNSRRKRA